jgi:hypothetical protein
MNYFKLNNLMGWVVFTLSLLTYLGTVSPTASFWDCGEFILVANELQVGHPPGASFWLLLGRVFATFAPNVESISYMVNLMSVLSSALSVLFTFWIITMLGKKALVKRGETPDQQQSIVLMLAGMTGALALNFTDSFWFNGVEAEVYAMSSTFTAAVVWLMLKWEENADRPDNFKWILLIAYLMGLSIGVHLLNLLCIPALAIVYYFRKYDFTWTGFLATLGISVGILAFIQYGVIQVTVDLAWGFEKLFVGTISEAGKKSGFGLPYNSGGVIFSLVLTIILIALIIYSQKRKMLVLNLAALSTLLIYIGFSSYFVILIRSNVNPPIDQNNPEHLSNFAGYVKREQYGDRPLFRGPMYNSSPIAYEPSGSRDILKRKGVERYLDMGDKQRPKYNDRDKVLFPRMHSHDHYNNPAYGYKYYVANKGADPDNPDDDKPSMAENFKFFFDYQINHMYWRYFFWNFGGRENDQQEAEVMGFPNGEIPDSLKKDPTANHFFYLPFLLGLLGFIWQYQKNRHDALIVLFLFLFTGLAIIVYLNQTPSQPRERDYSYAGSFQTFAIWIGLGVLFVFDILKKFLKNATAYVSGALCLLLVPFNMGIQNWKDHSRHGNFIARDTAYNFLNSCAPNAILFTYGDNDTFPLWYLQEVEGVRTDIRVVNLSYLNTDWYIYQMKNEKFNNSDPLPLTMTEEMYEGEKNQLVPFKSTTLNLPVNKQSLIDNKVFTAEEANQLPNTIAWNISAKGNNAYLERKDVVIINLINNIAKDGWKRPVYFATTVAPSQFMGLQDFFRQEGLTYRIVPMKMSEEDKKSGNGKIDKDILYNNLLHNFHYEGLADTTTFFDYESRRMVNNLRTNFFRLANEYVQDIEFLESRNAQYKMMLTRLGDNSDSAKVIKSSLAANMYRIKKYRTQAVEVLDFCDQKTKAVPYEAYNLALVGRSYEGLKEMDKALKYYTASTQMALDELKYDAVLKKEISSNRDMNLYSLQIAFTSYTDLKEWDQARKIAEAFKEYAGDTKFLDYLNQLNQTKALPQDTAPVQ